MSRRRRGVLLLGLALVFGGIAASDVSRREAALERSLGPSVSAVVARADVEPGTRLTHGHVTVRLVPARFAPAGDFGAAREVVGLRTVARLGRGEYLSAVHLGDGRGQGPDLRPGERVADVVAVASPDAIVPGSRVDVVVTREGEGGGPGRTDLALEDVEVLAAQPADDDGGAAAESAAAAPRVAAALRVTVRQAVYLAAAQSFARELRLLPRGAGDRERGGRGLSVGQDLR